MKLPHILCYVLLANLFLGTHEGMLALWQEGRSAPEEIYPCKVQQLPAEDQALLKKGIPIGSRAELTARLEDFLS